MADITAPYPAKPAGDSDDVRTKFLFQEHELLSKEIADQLAELWGFEKFGLGGAAALTAWLATHNTSTDYAWWLPFVFLALCAARFGAGMIHIVCRLAVYIQLIERRFLKKRGGYQTWFRKKSLVQTIAHLAVWAAALAMALYVANVHPRAYEIKNESAPVNQTANPAAPADQKAPLPGR